MGNMLEKPVGAEWDRWFGEYEKSLEVALNTDRCEPCRRRNRMSHGPAEMCDLHTRLLSGSYSLAYRGPHESTEREIREELLQALDDWNARFRKPPRPRVRKEPCPHNQLSIYRYVTLSSSFSYHVGGDGKTYMGVTNCGTGDDVRYDVYCYGCGFRRSYDMLHPLPERFAALLRRFPEEVREDNLLEEIQARRPTIFWNTERGRI